MKKKMIVISSIVITLVLLGMILYHNDSFRFKFSYESINNVEYNNGKKIKVSIPLNNPIKYISEQELIQILKEKTGILYFGYNTCPWCRNVVPILIQSAQKMKVDTIYYADIHRLNLSSIREELYQMLDSYLEEDENGKKVLAVPDVYFIKEGTIIGEHKGVVDSYRNPYEKMDNNQTEELVHIYQTYIKEMQR